MGQTTETIMGREKNYIKYIAEVGKRLVFPSYFNQVVSPR